MKKKVHAIYMLGMMAINIIATVSCSLVSFDFDVVKQDSYEMHLNKDTVYVMEGDTFSLSPLYLPIIHDGNAFWASDDSILHISGNSIIASNVGSAYVKAYSSYQNLSDSCFVNVMSRWKTPVYDYPNEMIVNAKIMFEGEKVDPYKVKVAAFINGECRGLGVFKNYFGEDIFQFRVCGNIGDYNEIVHFRIYILEELICTYFPQILVFDGDIHGCAESFFILEK